MGHAMERVLVRSSYGRSRAMHTLTGSKGRMISPFRVTLMGCTHVIVHHSTHCRAERVSAIPFSFLRGRMHGNRLTRILMSMGQSPWDNIKFLGHCGESVSLYVCTTKWGKIKMLGCPMLLKMRVYDRLATAHRGYGT